MNAEFIVSLLGDDRRGLIQFLEQSCHEHQAQWLASKFTHLDGQLAAVIKVSVPSENEQTLREFFVGQKHMAIRFSPVRELVEGSSNPLKLNIEAKDRLGLINEITQRLESLGVHIEHMECNRISVIEIGGSLLSIDINVTIPDELSEQELTRNLDDLSEHIVVNIIK